MAYVEYGDLHINVDQEALTAPAVTHFLTEVQKVFMQQDDIIGDLSPTIEIDGEKGSLPRSMGQSNFRKVDPYDDRTPRDDNVRFTRVELKWDAWDKDLLVPENIVVRKQVDMVNTWLMETMSAHQRIKQQVYIDALQGVKASNTSTKDADGVLAVIDSKWGFNTSTQKLGVGSTPEGWNQAKLALIDTIAGTGQLKQSGTTGLAVIAHHDTTFGFFQDVPSTNRDWAVKTAKVMNTGPAMGEGQPLNYDFRLLGDLPNDDDGNATGIKRASSTVSSTVYYIRDEHAFHPMCVRQVIPGKDHETGETQPPFYLEVFRDKLAKGMRYRASIYRGAAVVNPKGVLRVKNASWQTN